MKTLIYLLKWGYLCVFFIFLHFFLLFSTFGHSQTLPPMLTEGIIASTPVGWVDFCRRYEEECDIRNKGNIILALNEKNWKLLNNINDKINGEIAPKEDKEKYGVDEYWNYPQNKEGDYEDYVLLKKKTLSQAGFPLESMLITIVEQKDGIGHAVLTIVTDRGDFILDNQDDDIKIWYKTGYNFLKRQSQSNPNIWISLDTVAGKSQKSNSGYFNHSTQTEAPTGFDEFCKLNAQECNKKGLKYSTTWLNGQTKQKLEVINMQTNALLNQERQSIAFNPQNKWSYLQNHEGDSVSIALEKKRKFEAAGIPSDAMRLILIEPGVLYLRRMALAIRTNWGDFIADWQEPQLIKIDKFKFAVTKIQDGENPKRWFNIIQTSLDFKGKNAN